MATQTILAVTGDKGGVGKSTFVALAAEWFHHQGQPVSVVDADPNQTTQTYLDKCAEQGYQVSVSASPLLLVDTAGTSGASATRYIKDAHLIVVPFQPHVADLETVVGWFLMLREEMAERVVFVPNRWENTKEQRDGIAQLEAVLKEEGRGQLLSRLSNRPAVYPPLLSGSHANFFLRLRDKKAQAETEALMGEIERRVS